MKIPAAHKAADTLGDLFCAGSFTTVSCTGIYHNSVKSLFHVLDGTLPGHTLGTMWTLTLAAMAC